MSAVGAEADGARARGKPKRATSLLILNSKAGSMTPEIEAKLRKAFSGSLAVEFDPKMDLEKLVSPTATVIVAGGDGTIGWVVRELVDTSIHSAFCPWVPSTTSRSRCSCRRPSMRPSV